MKKLGSSSGMAYPADDELLEIERYSRSPNRGAGATRPKRSYTSPYGEVYFKFGLTNNEICAELFAYAIGKQLDLPMAVTRLAKSDTTLGIASYDNGGYSEINDEESYSIRDFVNVLGFIDMCLFDYLIMNEDRHAGNWGIKNNRVAPLFDHNLSFGGDIVIRDLPTFMSRITSSLYVYDHHEQSHDAILKYFVELHLEEVIEFMKKGGALRSIQNDLWAKQFPEEYKRLNNVLAERIKYMFEKVGEYGG